MPTIYSPGGDAEKAATIETVARSAVATGCDQFVFKGVIYSVTVDWNDTGYRTVQEVKKE